MPLSAALSPASLPAYTPGAGFLRRRLAHYRRALSVFLCALASPEQDLSAAAPSLVHRGQGGLAQNARSLVPALCTPRPGRLHRGFIPAAHEGDSARGPAVLSPLEAYLPLLAQLTQQRKWVVCIAPPAVISIDLLAQAGINESRFMQVHAKSPEGRSWALLQALQGRHCGAVLYWGDLSESLQWQIESVVQDSPVYCLWFKAD